MEQKRKLYKDTTQQPLWGIRKLTINPIDKDDLRRFPGNAVNTTKYTVRNETQPAHNRPTLAAQFSLRGLHSQRELQLCGLLEAHFLLRIDKAFGGFRIPKTNDTERPAFECNVPIEHASNFAYTGGTAL